MEQQKHLEDEKFYYQPDFLLGNSQIVALRQEHTGFRASLDKLRKGLFRRFDELSKLVMSLILRQDDRDLEMAKMKARLDRLEQELLQGTKSKSNVRTLHIVGRKPNVKPLYMDK